LSYYGKLAEFYIIDQNDQGAEKLFQQMIDLSNDMDIHDEYFHAIMGMVKLKKKHNNNGSSRT
jgi:hypothetical protein